MQRFPLQLIRKIIIIITINVFDKKLRFCPHLQLALICTNAYLLPPPFLQGHLPEIYKLDTYQQKRSLLEIYSSAETPLPRIIRESIPKREHRNVQVKLKEILEIKDKNTEKESQQINKLPLEKPRLPLSMFYVGQHCQGIIKKIQPFGLWIDIGCKQNGFLHIRNLSDDWIDCINDQFCLGESLHVQIKYLDTSKGILALTKPQILQESNITHNISEDTIRLLSIKVEDRFSGVIKRITKFGAFIDIKAEVDAFLHNMDMEHTKHTRSKRFIKPNKLLTVGKKLNPLYVKSVDLVRERIQLSMRSFEEELNMRIDLGLETREEQELYAPSATTLDQILRDTEQNYHPPFTPENPRKLKPLLIERTGSSTQPKLLTTKMCDNLFENIENNTLHDLSFKKFGNQRDKKFEFHDKSNKQLHLPVDNNSVKKKSSNHTKEATQEQILFEIFGNKAHQQQYCSPNQQYEISENNFELNVLSNVRSILASGNDSFLDDAEFNIANFLKTVETWDPISKELSSIIFKDNLNMWDEIKSSFPDKYDLISGSGGFMHPPLSSTSQLNTTNNEMPYNGLNIINQPRINFLDLFNSSSDGLEIKDLQLNNRTLENMKELEILDTTLLDLSPAFTNKSQLNILNDPEAHYCQEHFDLEPHVNKDYKANSNSSQTSITNHPPTIYDNLAFQNSQKSDVINYRNSINTKEAHFYIESLIDRIQSRKGLKLTSQQYNSSQSTFSFLSSNSKFSYVDDEVFEADQFYVIPRINKMSSLENLKFLPFNNSKDNLSNPNNNQLKYSRETFKDSLNINKRLQCIKNFKDLENYKSEWLRTRDIIQSLKYSNVSVLKDVDISIFDPENLKNLALESPINFISKSNQIMLNGTSSYNNTPLQTRPDQSIPFTAQTTEKIHSSPQWLREYVDTVLLRKLSHNKGNFRSRALFTSSGYDQLELISPEYHNNMQKASLEKVKIEALLGDSQFRKLLSIIGINYINLQANKLDLKVLESLPFKLITRRPGIRGT